MPYIVPYSSCSGRMSNLFTNALNSASGPTLFTFWDPASAVLVGNGLTAQNDGFLVDNAGYYDVYVRINQSRGGGGSRIERGVRFTINGAPLYTPGGPTGRGAYIRGASGSDTTDSQASDLVALQRGDVIGCQTFRTSSSSAALVALANECSFKIVKVENL